MPRGEALEAIAQAEAEALGEKGMLTGYGVNQTKAHKPLEGGDGSVEGLQLNWFLDGFRWGRGRDERQPFEASGQLSAEVSPLWPPGVLHVGLNVTAAEAPVTARASLHAYCGPPGPWDEALAALARGARAPLERLAREHACPGMAGAGVLATVEARPGQTVARSVALTPPPATAQRLWVEVRLVPQVGALGEGLLDRLGLYFVYAPER
jgi:hypothetical protein